MPIKPEEEVKQYIHEEQKRANNPPVGLVSAENDPLYKKKTYYFDPHLDPQLQWAGKAEGLSFDVDTISLHVHERIDPLTIIDAVRKKGSQDQKPLFHWFETKDNNPPIREAIEFYKHPQGWSNRLIAGDSLLVMNSLLEKEGMAGKIQMIYIDPPYGVRYGSNFQPFINNRDVKDGKDEDLTQEPEMIKAFRDTWELGIHSYLSYLRDRLLLARELLHESGSIFVQISDENVHHVRELCDEIFGTKNFCALVSFQKTITSSSRTLPVVSDYLVWYGKNIDQLKYRQLFSDKKLSIGFREYQWCEAPDGKTRRKLTKEELEDDNKISKGWKLFRQSDLTSQGWYEERGFKYLFNGEYYSPGANRHWSISKEGLDRLANLGRLVKRGSSLAFVRYLDDQPVFPISNSWSDVAFSSRAEDKIYVVQTSEKPITRCVLMTTDPGDLVLDPTCGSGTTAYVAEQWGRRWITCDTSRVSITLARQRLMTTVFDYYKLAHPKEGVLGGFTLEKVPHVTLSSVANSEVSEEDILYDRPLIDNSKKRVPGPFTVEAVPSPYVKSFEEVPVESQADQTLSRSGETLRQGVWRSEIIKAGIRGKSGQKIEFSRVETLSGAKWLHADAETKEKEPKRVVISFGPDYAPLEQKQVELALEEASHLFPKPKIVIFAAFQFDPEASKDIDEASLAGVALLKVQMNADLHTDDLKKKRSSNESFWLIGQPDVETRTMDDGKIVVEVKGFDYYNTHTGQLESGGPGNISMWMLDTDYDYRSLYPRQVFFPIAADDEGWSRLARILKTEIDPELIEHYRGTMSVPFKPGNAVAIKIIDDRGIESLKIIRM
jgi:adenine-specific DNA-methyltransferase